MVSQRCTYWRCNTHSFSMPSWKFILVVENCVGALSAAGRMATSVMLKFWLPRWLWCYRSSRWAPFEAHASRWVRWTVRVLRSRVLRVRDTVAVCWYYRIAWYNTTVVVVVR